MVIIYQQKPHFSSTFVAQFERIYSIPREFQRAALFCKPAFKLLSLTLKPNLNYYGKVHSY